MRLLAAILVTLSLSAQDKPSLQKVEQLQQQAADQQTAARTQAEQTAARTQAELKQARAELAAFAAQAARTSSQVKDTLRQTVEDRRVADALAADALARHLKDIDDKLAADSEAKKQAALDAKASSDRSQKWYMGIFAALIILAVGGGARWVSTHFQLKRVETVGLSVEKNTNGINTRVNKLAEDRLGEARRAEKELAFQEGVNTAQKG